MNMESSRVIRQMHREEAAQVAELVRRVFDAYVAVDYTAAGIKKLHRYISAAALRRRQAEVDFVILVCISAGALIGMVELVKCRHISLLFVEPAHHGHGIGEQLVESASAHCRSHAPEVKMLTLNASPQAVHIYENMGFHRTGPRQQQAGITFIPMQRALW